MSDFSISKLLSRFFGSQRGMSSTYIIIFVIILTFAIMLSGGGASLFTGNIASPDIPTPTYDPSAVTPAPTSSSSAVTDWKITTSKRGCQTNPAGMLMEIIGEGLSSGYIAVNIEITSGTFLATAFKEFTPSKQAYSYVVPNEKKYNTNKWKVEIYEGGTKSGDTFTGGTLKFSVIQDPTGCK